MISVKYDTPIDVTEHQYNKLMREASGMIAGEKDEETGQHRIKMWLAGHNKWVKNLIIKTINES